MFLKIIKNLTSNKDKKIHPQERDVCESIYQYVNSKDPYKEYRIWLEENCKIKK